MWRGKLLRGLEEALKGWIVGEHEEMRDVREKKCTAQYIWSNIELK
uniref:Uncharacterized protein n=1 Tax=Lepeophtheirus salmonis TaxID=72036 RepID=A0A0K2V3I6_LEPSM